jgi:hypothetical protein
MGGGAGISDADILSTTSLVSEREGNQALVDETLAVFKDVYDEYGAQVTDIQIATLKPGVPALAYYDGNGNIAFNKVYFDNAKMESAYDACVKSGFHPSKGNKTAMQAVAAHELGHKLTADVGTKLGMGGLDLDRAATQIVKEARGATKHRGVVQMASKISKYATSSNAEAIAEAFADVFCNGKKAHSESKAIVNVMNKYLKGGK